MKRVIVIVMAALLLVSTAYAIGPGALWADYADEEKRAYLSGILQASTEYRPETIKGYAASYYPMTEWVERMDKLCAFVGDHFLYKTLSMFQLSIIAIPGGPVILEVVLESNRYKVLQILKDAGL